MVSQKYLSKNDKEILKTLEFVKKKWDDKHIPHLGLNKEVYTIFKQMSVDGVEISTPLAIYCYLYSFTFDGRKSNSQVNSKAIENYYGIHRNTITNNINILTNYGLLEVRNNGYKKVNTYMFPKESKKKIKSTTYIQDKFHHIKIWSDLSPEDRLKVIPVYIWLNSFKDEKLEFVNVRIQQISKDLHIGTRKVKLIIEQLEDLKLISRIKNSDNLYIYSLFWKVRIKPQKDNIEAEIKPKNLKNKDEQELEISEAFVTFLQEQLSQKTQEEDEVEINLDEFEW